MNRASAFFPAALAASLWLAALAPATLRAAEIQQADLFAARSGAYRSYRIPSLLVAKSGTALAFCEGRADGPADSGNIDLILRRSADNGATWSEPEVVWNDGPNTAGNPCPVQDASTGVIHLMVNRNLGSDREDAILSGRSQASREVWILRSSDDGKTWSKPENITASIKKPEWTWYATGPGVGIQLASGRLVIPCDHALAGTKAYGSHVIFSDDHGATWAIGGVIDDKVNECQIAETEPNHLLLNMRSYHGLNRRAAARSADGGLTFGPLEHDAALIEPVCQASILAVEDAEHPARLVFANPAGAKRDKMTVRLSDDGGATWPRGREVHAGPSAYSCLARFADGTMGLLYERGAASPYERITLARFPIEWADAPETPARD